MRSDAIAAALRKGRDYAAALGVEVTAVEHVADTGLLGGAGDDARHYRAARRGTAFSAGGGGEGVDAPSLDPVPQELTAVIEARLRASIAALPS